MMNRINLLGVSLITVIFVAGCADRDLPTTEPSHPVSIKNVIASPPIVVEDHLTKLTAFAEDLDGGSLSYLWNAAKGKIIGEGETVMWQAPHSEGTYLVKITIRDEDENSDTKSVEIQTIPELNLIVPGVQMANIRLGYTLPQIITIHGNPDKIEGDTFEYTRLGILGAVNKNKQVWILMAISPYEGITADGIKIGSSLQEVERVFSSADEIADFGEFDVRFANRGEFHIYEVSKIAFAYDVKKEVIAIAILDPKLAQLDDNSPNRAEIIPGEEIAEIKLEEPFSQVKAIYGEPDEVIAVIFFYQDPPLGGIVSDINQNGKLDDNEPVIGLTVQSPYKGKTIMGNGIGSTMADIEREFGPPEKIDKKKNTEDHKYPSRGINFTYDSGTRQVILILIYPVGTQAAPPIDLQVFPIQ